MQELEKVGHKYIKQKDKIIRYVDKPKAIVFRYGAFGDLIMATPILKKLKEDGYYVVLNTQSPGSQVVVNTPYVDATIIQKRNEVPSNKLDEYWKEMEKGFDKVVNLSGTVEDALLKVEGGEKFKMSKEERHAECNKNYIDYGLKVAGYDDTGIMPEMHFTKVEHDWAKKLREKYKGKFLIEWSLSGSAFHKVYPFTEFVATAFLDRHPDAVLITVGDYACKILEWEHERTLAWSGTLPIRKSLVLTKYVDLVVGTETGVLNGASCYDTPKIIFLSHSTEENLTKYWTNTIAMHADVSCYPCHQLHYTNNSCKKNSATNSPICMSMIDPRKVLDNMEEIYKKWRNGGK